MKRRGINNVMCFCSVSVRRLQREVCFQVNSLSCRHATPLWTFLGPWGRFHLSSTDVAPRRDPSVFQRLLGTSEGNVWQRGVFSTEEQSQGQRHLAAPANPTDSCQWDEMLIFTYRMQGSCARGDPFPHLLWRG